MNICNLLRTLAIARFHFLSQGHGDTIGGQCERSQSFNTALGAADEVDFGSPVTAEVGYLQGNVQLLGLYHAVLDSLRQTPRLQALPRTVETPWGFALEIVDHVIANVRSLGALHFPARALGGGLFIRK